MLDIPRISSLTAELDRIEEKLTAKSRNAATIADYNLKKISLFLIDKISTYNLDLLCKNFQLSSFERDVVLLCFGAEIYSHWLSLCGTVLENLGREYVTFRLALTVLENSEPKVLSSTANLERWGLIQIFDSPNFTYSQITIDKQVFQKIIGLKSGNPNLLKTILPLKIETNLAPSHHQMAEQLFTLWVDNQNLGDSIFQLIGKDLSSKKALAKFVCDGLERELYTVSALSLLNPTLALNLFARYLAREYLLNDLVLLLDCDELESLESSQKFQISEFITSVECPLIITTKAPIYFEEKETIAWKIDLPSASEQKLLWSDNLTEITPDLNDQIERIVNHFSFSSPAISTIANQLQNSHKYRSLLAQNGDRLNGHNLKDNNPRASNAYNHVEVQNELNSNGEVQEEKDKQSRLWNMCRIFARPRLDELAQRIDSKVSWDDLIVAERERNILEEIAAHVRYRSLVYDSWGIGNKSSRGLGLSVLFAGSSGTGKTLAAEVLGNELNLDVYRIDLSMIVSKYIGETEKNLRKIFDGAENCGVILLFDEADALFGRRSEVKDSHDRYANMEVSYLLQRIETYRGLAILTTNLKQDIDSAFLRRIRFVVDFEFPDDAMREAIWRRIFPKETPTQDLDYKKLANLCLPGGNIRNIAIKAAFLAAKDGEKIQMKHLLKATQSECRKLNRIISDRETEGWVDTLTSLRPS